MKGILVGIIISLSILLWQNTEALKAQASHLPTLDVGMIRWLNEQDVVRNQIWAGSVNFGDEVILAEPGGWPLCRQELNTAYMLGVCSDLTASASGGATVVTLEGHRYNDFGWNASPLIWGIQPKGVPGDPGTLRVGLYYDRLCFAPPGSSSLHPNWFDACVERTGDDYSPDLKFTAGGKYVLLSELSTLLGR